MKVVTGFVTAMLVFLAGLVATPVAQAAQAVPYPHSITTHCHAKAVKNPIHSGTRPKMRFRITTDGNGRPKTLVRIRIIDKKTHRVVHRTHRRYNKPVEIWKFKKLQPGRYKFKFHTRTGPNSVFKNCKDPARLRVLR